MVILQQTCPVPLLVRTNRIHMSSDQKTRSKILLTYLHTCCKCCSTRTQESLWVRTPRLCKSVTTACKLVEFILSLFLHQCDPTLLPEPNHVMLNHLYALSIKVTCSPGKQVLLLWNQEEIWINLSVRYKISMLHHNLKFYIHWLSLIFLSLSRVLVLQLRVTARLKSG